MVARAAQLPGVAHKLRALPRQMAVGDLFSGAGTFHKVYIALMHALKLKFPEEMADAEVWGYLLL